MRRDDEIARDAIGAGARLPHGLPAANIPAGTGKVDPTQHLVIRGLAMMGGVDVRS